MPKDTGRPQEKLALYLKITDTHVTNKHNKLFKELNLTLQQALTIGLIHQRGDQSVNQRYIEEKLQISNPSVTGMIKSMETKGFLMRRTDPKDARNNILVLTDAAIALAPQCDRIIQYVEDVMAEGMTREEVRLLIKLLHKIDKNIERI